VRASANYNYSFEPKIIEPLKNFGVLNSRYLRFLKDININLLPSTVAVNSNIFRRYNEQLSRSLIEGLPQLPTLKQRHFMFDWDYNIGYDITRSLQFNFRAANNYIYDDFDTSEEVKLFDNFFTVGRPDHYHQTLNANYKIPINKIPMLEFIRSDYTYTADFDWQASSQSYISKIGNVIQNANTHNLGVDLDFDRFYKSIGLDKLFVKKKPGAEKTPTNSANTNDKNDLKKAKTTGGQIGRGLYSVLTAIKKARFNYSENNGTYLPGYVPQIGFLGRDNFNGSLAPTMGFVFGSQIDIRQRAVENGWLLSRDIDDPYFNKTYSRTHLNKFDASVTVQPLRNFDIELRGNKTDTKNISQQIDVVDNILNLESPEIAYGNFSISHNMLKTVFKNDDVNFEEFRNNRAIIAQRLASTTNQPIDGYGLTSQQVMLPAFLAAYSGKDASNISLNAFRDVPIPSWDITYKGFMQMDWFKKHFRSFSVSHKYNSLYSITSFSNNLEYNADDPYSERDIAGNYFNKTLFTNVNLVDEFSPLIKVDMKMKNSVSFAGRINKDRALTLNFNNNTITQIRGVEYVLGLGYRIKDLPMRFRFGGKLTRLKGDLDIRTDISLRDNKTYIRAIDEDNTQVTGGQRLLSLKVFADYAISQSLTASFYFDQSSSRYAVSTTFPRRSVNSRISIRYVFGN
jgi:cell surface protein SprA